MSFLGGLTGALGGLVSGGPLGAIAGGLAGLSDSGKQEATSGWRLRDWNPEEAAAVRGAYGAIDASQMQMTPAQRAAYVQQAAQSYFTPMQQQITEGLNSAMARNATMHARRGVAGSSQAQAQDRMTGTAAARELSSAAAQAQQYGNSLFMQDEANRRANMGAAQGLLSQMWNQRGMGSTQYQSTPSSPVGTGLGLLGMGLTSGSPWADKANNWIGGLLSGGGGGGGLPGTSPSDYAAIGAGMMGPTGMNTPGLRFR